MNKIEGHKYDNHEFDININKINMTDSYLCLGVVSVPLLDDGVVQVFECLPAVFITSSGSYAQVRGDNA